MRKPEVIWLGEERPATCFVDPNACGEQTGSDWANAMHQLPSTLVHGMRYLVRGPKPTVNSESVFKEVVP